MSNYYVGFTSDYDPRSVLRHHGILGQKWGVQNGPPYPLDIKDYSAQEKKLSALKQYKKDKILPRNATAQNLDDWGSKASTNVLYISGLSGSGKSTIALKLADKNTEVVHLDGYFEKNAASTNNKDFNSFLDSKQPNYKNLRDDKLRTVGDFEEFESNLEEYGNQCFSNGKKVIVEGIELLDNTVRPNKTYFKDKPFVMLNTSSLVSTIRANERDDRSFKFKQISDRAKWKKNMRNINRSNNLKHMED